MSRCITSSLALASLLFLSSLSLSGVEVITDTAKFITVKVVDSYTVGDSESIQDAEQVSLDRIKREAAEHAGSYITSKISIKNDKITEEEVRILSAGFQKTLKIS